MEIRKAKEDDLELIYPLCRYDLISEQPNYDKELYEIKQEKQCKKSTIDYLKSFLGKRNKIIFIAVEKNKVVGCCLGGIKKRPSLYKIDKVCEIENVIVSKDYRRKSIGIALMKEIKKWGKSRAKFARLTVEIKNKPAVGLYKKAGFNEEKVMMRVWLK